MGIHGNDAAGFAIQVEQQNQTLSLRAWGFWGDALARAYQQEMLHAFGQLAGTRWTLLIDLSGYLPQRQETHHLQERVISEATARGLKTAVVIVTNAITRMQVRRLAASCGGVSWSFHASPSDAQRAPSEGDSVRSA